MKDRVPFSYIFWSALDLFLLLFWLWFAITSIQAYAHTHKGIDLFWSIAGTLQFFLSIRRMSR